MTDGTDPETGGQSGQRPKRSSGIPAADKGTREKISWITGHTFTIIWLIFAWISWVVAIGGVSAAQDRCTPGDGRTGVRTLAYLSGGPQISCNRFFRLPWWVVFYDLVVLVMVSICVSKKMKYLATARAMLVGYLAVGVVLSTIVADFFNNLRDTTGHRGSIHIQARVGFAGFLMETFCFYMLMYMVGVNFEGFNLGE